MKEKGENNMAVPETIELVLPLLEIIKDKDEYKVREIADELMEYIDISDEDKEIRLPNNETLIYSRISTANTYLKKAELIESNRFMYFNISEEGLKILDDNPDEITEDDLMQYPGFKEYKQIFVHDEEDRSIDLNDEDLDPTKALKESFKKQMEDVKKEIDEEVKREKQVSKNKKYFQSKEYKDEEKVFGIKANRKDNDEEDDKHSKCHGKKKRCHHKKHCHHKHKKLVLNIEFSPAEELLNYAELFEKGYLTKEEFEKKKEELLKIDYTL